MPDPKQELAVGGPLPERLKRRLTLIAFRLVRLPIRILTFPITRLREEVMSLRAAAVESLAYVGVELRRLGDLIERGQPAAQGVLAPAEADSTIVEAPFAFRSLGAVSSPGPVLIVGERAGRLEGSLASLGYDVRRVDRVDEVSAEDDGFKAALYMPAQPDAEELRRIGDLLADDGLLVMTVAFGAVSGNGAAGLDETSIDSLLKGWSVADRVVVAGAPGGGWAPVRNGGTPDRGVALVAARREPATT